MIFVFLIQFDKWSQVLVPPEVFGPRARIEPLKQRLHTLKSQVFKAHIIKLRISDNPEN
jgi:hypothetical protein